MNEHAKKIYQAALDGKTVQRRREFWVDDWEDKDPFEAMEGLWPWRIKPRIETRYYRVLLAANDNNNNDLYPIAIKSNCKSALDYTAEVHCQTSIFRRWLTDWIPYEVEVEE